MRTTGFITIFVGFLVLIGTAGADDFNQVCRAAADCVAEDPMTAFELFIRMVAGVTMMAVGSLLVWVTHND